MQPRAHNQITAITLGAVNGTVKVDIGGGLVAASIAEEASDILIGK